MVTRAPLGMLVVAFACALPATSRAANREAETKRLFDAVAAGNTRAVSAMVTRKKSLLKALIYPIGDTPLMAAAFLGDHAMVKLLLGLGADPNLAPDPNYRQAALARALRGIHTSRYRGEDISSYEPVLASLLGEGANPNATYVSGGGMPTTTAVLEATDLAPSTLAMLLGHRGDASIRDGNGTSAMELLLRSVNRLAREDDVLAKATALVSAGYAPADEKETARSFATALLFRWRKVVGFFEEKKLVPLPKSQGWATLAWAAAVSGWSDWLERALTEHPDLENKGWGSPVFVVALDSDWTGKHIEATWRPERERALHRLLDAGARPDGVDGRKCTPLMLAARAGLMSVAKRIVSAVPATVNAVDDEGWTALHYAASGRQPDVVALLLQRGSRATAATEKGQSALELAAAAGAPVVVKQLAPSSTPAQRQAAMTAFVDSVCKHDKASKFEERAAETLSELFRQGSTIGDQGPRLGACGGSPFRLRLPQNPLAAGQTAEALLWPVAKNAADAWRPGWTRAASALSPWMELAAGFPQTVTAEGNSFVLLGICQQGEGSLAAAWLQAIVPTVERRPWPWKDRLACPLVDAPLRPSLVKNQKLRDGGRLIVAILPGPAQEKARHLVATLFDAQGALVSHGAAVDDLSAKPCYSYNDERADLRPDGKISISLRCGDEYRRWTAHHLGDQMVFEAAGAKR